MSEFDPIRKSDLAGQDPIVCKFALMPADAAHANLKCFSARGIGMQFD
jgi:hypothetical protein